MAVNCPFCGAVRADLFGLSFHLEDDHPKQAHLVVAVSSETLPVIEVDIDRVHTVYGARAQGE